MPIPAFNIDGVLPPFVGIDPGQQAAFMSPYEVTVAEVVGRFATTPDRRAILVGWLEYRAVLRAKGLRRGFQWLDGSFLEDKDPQDLDLMLFVQRPARYRSDQAF